MAEENDSINFNMDYEGDADLLNNGNSNSEEEEDANSLINRGTKRKLSEEQNGR